jgi:O-antigen ligase
MARGAPQTAAGFGVFCLVLLVAFLPVTRVAAQFLLPSGGATSMARLHVGVMELLVIATVFLDRRVTIPSLRRLPGGVLALLAGWLGWSLAAIAVSAVPGMAMARQVEWLTHAAFGWAVWSFFRTYPHHAETALRWLVRGFLVYGVLLAFFLLNLPHPETYPWVNGILGFANVRHFGYYAAVALVAAHWPLLAPASRAGRLGQLILLAVIWGFLAWSGSRGPIFAVFGALAVLTVFRALPEARRIWGVTLTAFVIGASLSVPFTPVDGSFGILRFAQTMQQADSLAQYSAGRAQFWEVALGLVRDHPLLGLGPDQLLVGGAAGPFHTFVQPHNLLLQVALEWGIPGGLMFLGLIGAALLAGLGKARTPGVAGHQVIGLWVAGMLTALALIDGTYYHALPLMMLALGLALALSPARAAPAGLVRRRPPAFTALAAGCALLTLVSAAAFWALLAAGTPAPGSWRVHLVESYASPMALLGGGSHLDGWAGAWAATDRPAAYRLLDWSARHSRMPWTSQAKKAEIMMASGEAAAGRRLLDAAHAREQAVTGTVGPQN